MGEQLQLDLAVLSADPAVRTADPAVRTANVTQLAELPGTEWEHIFGLPAPGDGPDGPFGAFKHPREEDD